MISYDLKSVVGVPAVVGSLDEVLDRLERASSQTSLYLLSPEQIRSHAELYNEVKVSIMKAAVCIERDLQKARPRRDTLGD